MQARLQRFPTCSFAAQEDSLEQRYSYESAIQVSAVKS